LDMRHETRDERQGRETHRRLDTRMIKGVSLLKKTFVSKRLTSEPLASHVSRLMSNGRMSMRCGV
jgi:hypothetical protein